mmetsp:Transcript_16124/g.38703  ORF Transcript_16124/g.38703 Transcript_16124/m.38703 type:complete len:251 (-) Transcript_16124:592-1344(-)
MQPGGAQLAENDGHRLAKAKSVRKDGDDPPALREEPTPLRMREQVGGTRLDDRGDGKEGGEARAHAAGERGVGGGKDGRGSGEGDDAEGRGGEEDGDGERKEREEYRRELRRLEEVGRDDRHHLDEEERGEDRGGANAEALAREAEHRGAAALLTAGRLARPRRAFHHKLARRLYVREPREKQEEPRGDEACRRRQYAEGRGDVWHREKASTHCRAPYDRHRVELADLALLYRVRTRRLPDRLVRRGGHL